MHWNVVAADQADYITRVVAVVPADSARFNCTVVVEWLNVSGGPDAPAVWLMGHRELLREGYAYVGSRPSDSASMAARVWSPTCR